MSIFANWQFGSNPNQDQGILALLQQMQAQPNGGAMPQTAQQPAPGSWPESPTSNYMMGGTQVPLYGNAPEQPQVSAAARQAPASQPVAQAAPAMQSPQAPQQSFGDKMRDGFQGFVDNAHTGLGGAILGGVSRAMGGQNATEKALIAKGVDSTMAKAARENPQLMAALLPQVFGSKTGVINNRLVDMATGREIKDYSDTKAPETRTFQGPDGKIDMQYDHRAGKWVPIPSLSAQTAAQPGNQQFGQAGTLPPPPKGADVDKYRSEGAEAAMKDATDAREKAKGAIEFLQRVQRFSPTVAQADPSLFGPMAGTEGFHNYVRAPGAAAFDALSLGNNSSGRKNMEDWSKLQAGFKDVSTSMLKARMGSANLSNVDVNTINQISGGTTSANPQTSLDILGNLSAEAIDRIKDGVKRGVITPEDAAPYLNFKMPTTNSKSGGQAYKVIGVR